MKEYTFTVRWTVEADVTITAMSQYHAEDVLEARNGLPKNGIYVQGSYTAKYAGSHEAEKDG